MTIKTKKILVTGGAGFIGSHLVDALLELGHEVLVIDDLSTGKVENLENAVKYYPQKLKIEQCDITDSIVAQLVGLFKPEIIFHLAAQMNVRKSVEDPIFDADKNIIGTIKLLESSIAHNVAKFIFSSTGGAIYGEQEFFPATERHPTNPESPYGISKRSAELYLEYYSRVSTLKCVSLRYGNVYGPRQNPKGEAGVVAIFCRNLIEHKPLKINGDGLQTRDYVNVADVVAANLMFIEDSIINHYQCFNIGLGVETSVIDIVQSIKKAASSSDKKQLKVACEVIHGEPAKGEQRRSSIDATRIKQIGWQAKTSFDQGILQTLESFLP